jgi:MSHA biogenesis protein MshL
MATNTTRQLWLRAPSPSFKLSTLLLLSWLSGCGTSLPATDPGKSPHIEANQASTSTDSAIPTVVTPAPLLPPPTASAEPELYTVVAQDVPLRDLLFNLARDASINVDIDPTVSGLITLNAIDQTLPQILERIGHQSAIRWRLDDSGNLVVSADSPYWATYNVDYVNVQREANTQAAISTSINSNVGQNSGGGNNAGSGAGANLSSSNLQQNSNNDFWQTLTANLATLLGETTGTSGGNGQNSFNNVLANPESGVVSVRGNSLQQKQVADFIKRVETRSLYQVLIEATVVEVSLSDDYQSGVDWSTMLRNNGEISFVQDLGADIGDASANLLTINKRNSPDAITATIALLSQFGELRVLSSPKIMALNNQAAMLRVVDNKVYFTIEAQGGTIQPNLGGNNFITPAYTTTVHTVPVGFVLTVTPQVGADDQVTLNVRPTISRIVQFVNDPSPILAEQGIENQIPEIQVREMESVLKVFSGQTAILGGLMQDSLSKDINGLPVLSRMPGVRNLFSKRQETANKTELIVFIRPVVIREPSLDGDLQPFQNYLPTSNLEQESAALNPQFGNSQRGNGN